MMELPDVVGMYLPEARTRLSGAGIECIQIRLTSQPRRKNTALNDDGCYRVIRVKIIDNKQVELLVCNPSN